MMIIKDMTDDELEDIIMDSLGRLELTIEQVELEVLVEKEIERRSK